MKRINRALGYLLTFVLCSAVLLQSTPIAYADGTGISTSANVTDYNAGDTAVPIDDALTLSGFDSATISSAKVLIRNKKDGDQLHYSALNGISGSYATTGVLSLSGEASPADYQAALRSVTFSTTSTNTEDRVIDFAIGSGLYSSDTGHFYEYVPHAGITWDNARTAAALKSLYGRQGYLVTITSQEENNFVQQKTSGIGWIGAKDINPYYGDWRWVTGPEGTSDNNQGLKFWSGYVKNSSNNVSTTVGIYANWANAEPNNSTNEYVVHIYNTDGKWNDFSPTNSNVTGYIVEYGGMSTDTPLSIQASKKIAIYDVAAPVVSTPNLTVSGITYNGVTLSWVAASDGITTTSSLQYKVVYSASNNIATTSDAIANGTVAMDWTSATLTNSVTGLSPGTNYYFTVLVKDEAGNVSAYNTQNQSTSDYVGSPYAPTNVSAVAGNGKAMVSFTLPSNNGGSTITGYTVTASPGGITAAGITSTITVSGLTNGTLYTFTVTATNSNGTSTASAPSSAVRPRPLALINDYLRFGPGNIDSINAYGNLLQPFYYGTLDSVTNWYKLTYSSYPLDYAIGIGGDGTSNWNSNGTKQENLSLSGQTTDDSQYSSLYVSDGVWKGYGRLSTTGNVTIDGKALQVRNTYELASTTASYIKITSTVTNKSADPATNLRYWVGTRDDWVGNTDAPTKTRGNIVSGEFTPITSQTQQSQAIKISSGDTSVLFFSTSSRAYTMTNETLGFSSIINMNPSNSPIQLTDDSSYGMYLRLNDLDYNESDSFVWYYAAGSVSSLSEAVQEIQEDVIQSATTPDPPSNVSAQAGNGQAVVSFNPPVNNGGATITTYTVTASPGGVTASGISSPITVAGLTNGTGYTFTVKATNSVGESSASSSSALVTPVTVPSAPSNVSAVAGNGQAIVSFDPPGSSGGSNTIDYTVTASPGGLTASGISSPITLSGLTNGTSYTFTVTARNAIGTGNASTPSSAVTPATVPSAPRNVSAVAGNGQAVVSFDPPISSGGAVITRYTVTSSPGSVTATGSSSGITVSGLTNGTGYTFAVTATNSAGESSASSSSALVTPMTVPSAVTNVSAVAGNGQAIVSFDPPVSNGGSVITGYIVTANPSGITVSGIASPITMAGLTNGVGYTFTAVALNSEGSSAVSSASALVIPTPSPSRSQTIAPNAVTSTVNGQTVQIGTQSTETHDGQTQTVISLNPAAISNITNTMPQGSTLILPASKGTSDSTTNGTTVGTTDGTKVGMTLGLVDQLFHQDIALQIDTGQIAYTLPANSIDIPTLLTKFEGNVPESQVTFDITISDVPTKMLEVVQNTAAKDEFAIVIPPVEFNVTATYNGQTVSVNQFSQHVSREIALPAGTDPKKITTAIVVKEDGTTYHVPTDVYQKDGQWYARISSLTNSVYTLIYNETTFADTKGKWFEAPVAEAASRTILAGYEDGTFRGTNPITRAEFAAMIVNTLGLDRVGTSNYPDVKEANWFYGVVSRASEYKVVSGRLNGSFDPNAYITRQEAMIMMQRAGQICGLVPGEGNAAANPAANAAAAATTASNTAATLSNDYADQAAISTWAREAVEYNLKFGLMKGSNGQLKPRDNITRAEAAVTILRLLQKSHLIDPRSAV